MQLVMKEMEWVVRCFQHHEEVWRQRAEKSVGNGQKAYAWKQSSMWGERVVTAKDAFGAAQEDLEM